MAKQRSTPWLAILLGLGCVGILCIGVLILGGGAAYYLTQNPTTSSAPTQVSNLVEATPQPTIIPTILPTQVQHREGNPHPTNTIWVYPDRKPTSG